jgi:hypothetical protein
MQSIFGQMDKDNIFNALQPWVSKGFNFVEQEYARFKKEGDLKLSQRYKLLYDYYLSRVKKWRL